MEIDSKALAKSTAEIVRAHLNKTLAPVLAENKALRDRIEEMEARERQRDADMATLRQRVTDIEEGITA
ncbi:hypothetical protein [Sphingobium estronivorans]|uniref:hypothetical protein n=1 Tax=Sphingobium estronivorans TaxID=1577690 RepID=UPI00123BA2D3|nr:hypothetical protein [Sphingobium estronivorans]